MRCPWRAWTASSQEAGSCQGAPPPGLRLLSQQQPKTLGRQKLGDGWALPSKSGQPWEKPNFLSIHQANVYQASSHCVHWSRGSEGEGSPVACMEVRALGGLPKTRSSLLSA